MQRVLLLTGCLVVSLACTGNLSSSSSSGGSGSGTTPDAGSIATGGDDAGQRDSGTLQPPDPNEPMYNPSSHHLIVRDDFNGYATMDDANDAYPVGRSTEFVELITGRGDTGHAIRLNYGAPDWADDILFGVETRLDSVGGWNGMLPEVAGPYTHFVFTTWMRASVGSDPVENDDTGSGVKGFMFCTTEGATSRR